MAIKVVSDLHSGVESLRDEVAADDTLLLLGDLVNIIDYRHMDGVLVEIFGHESVRRVVELRAQGRGSEALAVMAERREGREQEIAATFKDILTRYYQDVAAALPQATYLIYGNVDSPNLADAIIPPHVVRADGKVFDIGGYRIGFIGGGLPTPLMVAGEIPEEVFDSKIDALGEVDILCSHMPPDLPELTYDTLARRHERGSARLLEYIRDVQPVRAFFGHIHQPLVSSTHVGRTHLVNVGYFRATRRAYTLRGLA